MVYSSAAALLHLSTKSGAGVDHPYSIPEFQLVTGVTHAPWTNPAELQLANPCYAAESFKPTDYGHVRAFRDHFHSLPHGSRCSFVDLHKGPIDSFKVGRDKYKAFVGKIVGRMKMKSRVEEALRNTHVNLFAESSHLSQDDPITSENFSLNDARAALISGLLGDMYLTYNDNGTPRWTNEAKFFSTTVFDNYVYSWRKQRSRLFNELKGLDGLKERYAAISKPSDGMNTPSHGELMKLAIDIEDLLNAATTLHQDDSRATILTMEREYLELLDAKPEELIRINSRVSKAIQMARLSWASQHDVDSIRQVMKPLAANVHSADECDEMQGAAVDTALSAKLKSWSSGVEAYDKAEDIEGLLFHLHPYTDVSAVSNFPGFNTLIDKAGLLTPHEHIDWLRLLKREKLASGLDLQNLEVWDAQHPPSEDEDAPGGEDRVVPLCPRPHQIIGVHAMVANVLRGKSTLLMDGVGLGKTMQAIGVISCLAHIIDYQEANEGKLPLQWRSAEMKITLSADRPFVIVVPNNLFDQWMVEMKRYLSPGQFDIYPLTGGTVGRSETHDQWWVGSKTSMFRRIVIATHSAVADDARWLLNPVGLEHGNGEPKFDRRLEGDNLKGRAVMQIKLDRSVYIPSGYNVAIMDELHLARKPGHLANGLKMLTQRALGKIGITATPMMNSPLDLTLVCKILRIPLFGDSEWLGNMVERKRQFHHATEQDRADRKTSIDVETLHAQATGAMAIPEGDHLGYQNTRVAVGEFMEKAREACAEYIVRRTRSDKTVLGLDLPDVHQPIIGLLPTDFDKRFMEHFANEIRQTDKRKRRLGYGTFATNNFYHTVRSSLIHPSCVVDSPFTFKTVDGKIDMDEWNAGHTAKLDAMVQICKHHLQAQNASPLEREEGSNKLVPSAHQMKPTTDTRPDKIVIFSTFVKYNHILVATLRGFDIDVLELNGKVPAKKRHAVLSEFRGNSETTPRVLLLSSIGSVGLNIDVANVVIMLAPSWSGIETEQIVGRVHRPPQRKEVTAYHLLVLDSPEIFLSRIANEKHFMHSAFMNASESVKVSLIEAIKYLDEEDPEEYEKENMEAEVDPDAGEKDLPVSSISATRGRGRSRRRGRAGASVDGSGSNSGRAARGKRRGNTLAPDDAASSSSRPSSTGPNRRGASSASSRAPSVLAASRQPSRAPSNAPSETSSHAPSPSIGADGPSETADEDRVVVTSSRDSSSVPVEEPLRRLNFEESTKAPPPYHPSTRVPQGLILESSMMNPSESSMSASGGSLPRPRQKVKQPLAAKITPAPTSHSAASQSASSANIILRDEVSGPHAPRAASTPSAFPSPRGRHVPDPPVSNVHAVQISLTAQPKMFVDPPAAPPITTAATPSPSMLASTITLPSAIPGPPMSRSLPSAGAHFPVLPTAEPIPASLAAPPRAQPVIRGSSTASVPPLPSLAFPLRDQVMAGSTQPRVFPRMDFDDQPVGQCSEDVDMGHSDWQLSKNDIDVEMDGPEDVDVNASSQDEGLSSGPPPTSSSASSRPPTPTSVPPIGTSRRAPSGSKMSRMSRHANTSSQDELTGEVSAAPPKPPAASKGRQSHRVVEKMAEATAEAESDSEGAATFEVPESPVKKKRDLPLSPKGKEAATVRRTRQKTSDSLSSRRWELKKTVENEGGPSGLQEAPDDRNAKGTSSGKQNKGSARGGAFGMQMKGKSAVGGITKARRQ